MRKVDTPKTGHAEQMATMDELQQEPSVDGNEQAVGLDDIDIFSSISKNNSLFQSLVRPYLIQTISSMDIVPGVDFIDDPENDSWCRTAF